MIDKNPAKPTDHFRPIGTFVLLSAVALGMLVAWLFLYFAVFLPRGIVH